jgi:protein gp37
MASKIEWTEETWNPVVGCDKVSDGCKNCYAIKQAYRMMHMPHSKVKYAGTVKKTEGGALNWTGQINMHEESLLKPLRTKKPTVFFVNSMSDLFHKDVPFAFINLVFGIMAACPEHTFQVLTKRPERMLDYFKYLTHFMTLKFPDQIGISIHSAKIDYPRNLQLQRVWPLPNVWLGVSVENQKTADERIPLLLRVPAAVRWLSMEPLLGAVNIDFIDAPEGDEVGASRIWPLTGKRTDMARPCQDTGKLNWIVVGGESGHDARPMHPDWVRSIMDQCKAADVPFFFKQWGEYMPHCQADSLLQALGNASKTAREFPSPHNPEKVNTYYKLGKHESGRKLDGVVHDEYPKPNS